MVMEDIQVQGLYLMAKQTEIESRGVSTNGGQFSRVHGRTRVSSFVSSSSMAMFMDGELGHGTGRRRGSSARAEWWGRKLGHPARRNWRCFVRLSARSYLAY